jgi:hypothetical protein
MTAGRLRRAAPGSPRTPCAGGADNRNLDRSRANHRTRRTECDGYPKAGPDNLLSGWRSKAEPQEANASLLPCLRPSPFALRVFASLRETLPSSPTPCGPALLRATPLLPLPPPFASSRLCAKPSPHPQLHLATHFSAQLHRYPAFPFATSRLCAKPSPHSPTPPRNCPRCSPPTAALKGPPKIAQGETLGFDSKKSPSPEGAP